MRGYLNSLFQDYLGLDLSPGEFLEAPKSRIGELEIMTRSAAIAFYAFLALVPFIVVVLTLTIVFMPPISGTSDGETQLSGRVADEFEGAIAPRIARRRGSRIESQIARIQQEPPVGLLSRRPDHESVPGFERLSTGDLSP